MKKIKCHNLNAENNVLIETVAKWYHQEWHIPVEKAIDLLKEIAADPNQYHLVLMINDKPIATAGLHDKLGITSIDPSLKSFKNWLALVYTVPEHRKKGYAALLCTHIEKIAKERDIENLYLFTHTAESLYISLNWKPMKRLKHKDIVVMKKEM